MKKKSGLQALGSCNSMLITIVARCEYLAVYAVKKL